MKRVASVIVFLLICILITFALTDVLKQKWLQEENNSAQQIVLGYYREKPNTIDVLGIGASTIRNGVSPLGMYDEFGFTSYIRATSIQIPMISYHLMMETLETQDLKAVVMDASSLINTMMNGYTKEDIAGKIHEAIDYMPWSSHKEQIIQEAIQLGYPVAMEDFVFPLSAYHDRWAEISEDDFTYRAWQNDYCYRGQNPIIRTTNYTFDSLYMVENDKEQEKVWIDTTAAEYYRKIAQVCKEKGILFILVKTPSSRATSESSKVIQSFAEEENLILFDFNQQAIQEEIQFNSHTDYADSGDHPNVTGAKKISHFLGEYITSVCKLEDKRENTKYSSWKEDVQQYSYLLEDAELARETNIISYLQKACKPGYLVMMATRNDTALHFTEDLAETFKELDINANFSDIDYLSYAAIINDGEIIKQVQNEDPYNDNNPVQCEAVINGHKISVMSQASKVYSKASIIIDGRSAGSTSSGFNYVVYDKRISQIVSVKTFKTGLKGTEYRYPNPFANYTSDPTGYFKLLDNEDYITIIGVATEGSRYMPGIVNDKLAEMGLIPLDKELDRPYLAVLDGAQVVYNEYGEPGTEILKTMEINGVNITAISNTSSSDPHVFFSVGEEQVQRNGKPGLIIYVYSKTEQKQVTYNRFDWRLNQLSERRVNGITNILELLKATQKNGYDVFCLNIGTENDMTKEYLTAIREYGFDGIDLEEVYAGSVTAEGNVQQSGDNTVELKLNRDGTEITLKAGETTGEAVFDGITYTADKEGLYLFVYDPACKAVLTQVRYQESEIPKEQNPFDAYYGKPYSNPFPYFELLDNDDYITVIGVATEGSRYMPGVVNDKLAEMGLIPLDKELNRPYLAVLDGRTVVWNEYGEPSSEIMANLEVAGVKVSLISNTKAPDAHMYISVGEETPQKNKNPGLIFYVYSKSEQKQVGYNRFEWSGNQLSVQKVSGTTNILELLTMARRNAYGVFCLNIGKGDTLSEAYLKLMKDYGFSELDMNELYAGYVLADGQDELKTGSGTAEVTAELEGLMLELKAGEVDGEAIINGVTYAVDTEGLYLFIYDPVCRAVLSQVKYGQ